MGNSAPLIAVAYGEILPLAGPDETNMLELCEDVAAELRALGYRSEIIAIPLNLRDGAAALKALKPDLIFNLVDTIDGVSSLGPLAPVLFEHLKIPYTSGNAESIYITTGKILAKQLLKSHNIPTPGWFTPECPLPKRLARPYIVKSVTEDGSVGIRQENVTDKPEEIRRLMEEKAAKHRGEWFAEEYIDGREFNVSVIGANGTPKVLPIAEICFENYPKGKPKIVDYSCKWEEDSFEYHNTPRRFPSARADAPLLKKMKEISIDCWKMFGLTGYARVDFRVDAKGTPYVLEVNVNPCMDRDAGFPAAAEKAGISYRDLIGMIVDEAATRYHLAFKAASSTHVAKA